MRWIILVALAMAVLIACSPNDLGFSYRDLPPGDPARGAAQFADTCAHCHALDSSKSVGPSLAGYGAQAGERVRNQSAEEYTFFSILRPTQHTVQGYSNVMPKDFAEKLSKQQIADLIAYLLTL
jgi:mono/diheme cytochrome c family protein